MGFMQVVGFHECWSINIYEIAKEEKHVKMNGERRHIANRHSILFGEFGLDFRELNIQDCSIKGPTFG